MSFWRSTPAGRSALVALLLFTPAALAGQERSRDFLLHTPKVTLGLRAGYALASASSDVFDFSREQLTLERRDFDAASWGGQLAVRVTPRVDVALDLSVASSSPPSEFRDWVGTDDLPIEQTTEFRRVPLTLGVKAYLKDRGRSVGRFAWIPTTWAPYVGAAGGWVWYRFIQEGEFVDFETLDIFRDRFTAEGKTPTIHLYGGADWSLAPGLLLTAEGRYQWARADMSGDFVDFDAMDLAGFQGTVGISLRF